MYVPLITSVNSLACGFVPGSSQGEGQAITLFHRLCTSNIPPYVPDSCVLINVTFSSLLSCSGSSTHVLLDLVGRGFSVILCSATLKPLHYHHPTPVSLCSLCTICSYPLRLVFVYLAINGSTICITSSQIDYNAPTHKSRLEEISRTKSLGWAHNITYTFIEASQIAFTP